MTSILLLSLILAFFGADLVKADCTPFTGQTDVVVGEISDIFTVDIEAALTDKNVVNYMTVTFDEKANNIRILRDSYANGQQDILFDFISREKLVYDVKAHKCTVNQLSADDSDLFFVGGMRGDRINNALAFVHLDGDSGFGSPIVAHKADGGHQRGYKTTQYTSCQKWTLPEGKFPVTVAVDLSNDTWSKYETGYYPVRINIANDASSNTQINRTFNFFNFRSSRTSDAFQKRDGFFCPGLRSEKPFPKVPPYLSYGQEINAGNESLTAFAIYDSINKFMMFDVLSSDGNSNVDGVQYRDYTTGLAYVINPDTMRCRVANISSLSQMPFDQQNKGMVQQMTPEMFFDKTSDNTFYYMGYKNVRGIDAESWVALLTIDGLEGIVEWYFATNSTISWNLKTDLEKEDSFRIPLARKLWLKSANYALSSNVNLYDVQFAEPSYSMIALEPCFPSSQLALVSLSVPMTRDQQKSITRDINKFQWKTATSLAQAIGVNILRISEVSPTFYANQVEVDMVLLGPPPYASDIPKPATDPLTLQQAVDKLKSLVSSGSLTVTGADDKHFKVTNQRVITATSSAAAKQIKTSPQDSGSSGYSPGAMAGLGIAMLILSGGAGAGLAYRFIKV